MKQCPFCAEDIQDSAIKCKHCGERLPDPTRPTRATDTVNFARTIAADPVRPGMTLAARYRILERIGSGGMGDVFLAHDAELADMPVAVKVLPALLARNTPSIEGLKREAAIALRLSHPHICRLHNFHSDGDIKFLVMEHLPGQTLEALLAARPDRQMTWEELRPLAQHLASALDYAHALRPPIVHGDLKPANIMVTPDGMAKLLDFGIAREIRTSLTRITGREETSGTLPYMSPEQFRGETLSAASDLYSFCAVLYEALAGRPLVNPGGSLAWQIQDRPFDPLTGQPAWVNALLAAGLSKNASERPATITALLELAHPPKVVPPPPPVMIAPPPPPVPAPEQPQPIPAASTIPTVTTVTSNPPVQSIPAVPLVPLVPSVAAKPAAPTPAPAATPRKPRRRLITTALLLLVLVLATIATVMIDSQYAQWAANSARESAEASRAQALHSGAQYAATEWSVANNLLTSAQGQLDARLYAQAKDAYTQAAAAFQKLALEASLVSQASLYREEASAEESAAQNAQAQQFAPASWSQAQALAQQAAAAYANRDFTAAADTWQKAQAAFSKAQSEAVKAQNDAAAAQRKKRIADLLATAQDNERTMRTGTTQPSYYHENAETALAALYEILKLDPQNAQALALQKKIAAYFPRPATFSSIGLMMGMGPTAKDSQQDWANYLGFPTEAANTLGMKFRLIPPGTFTMGSPAGEVGRFEDEGQHRVSLTRAFLMGLHPVTVGQFRQFVQASGYKTDAERGDGAAIWDAGATTQKYDAKGSWKNVGFPQGDDHPVVCVSWNDAAAFCQWLSTKESKQYRLPTEAEWEYACRAGTTTAYPWGDNADDGKGWANCADLTFLEGGFGGWPHFNWRDGFVFTSPVGSFKPNAFGLYDMIGNVEQWCGDGYSGASPQTEQTDPIAPVDHEFHAIRGGSWRDNPQFCRSGRRSDGVQDRRYCDLGFRVVLDVGPLPAAPASSHPAIGSAPATRP